ncbi:hypothetical protein E4T38_05392 [Aureobasidium subglaciale]|nr:hypothetical protein E4T38_05392 [Aureobasidium subglaciale]KAI5221811.1 hypothetical protein E4T40_05325 [Aureobasidium subglaciale]KAI5225843.1 hypothetical protein E4T41_05144 [Aureobasidium subglaciale]KAI5261630.1 hypothetical protein E4T46_05036 [Aureobasidium subglaciale]
MSNRESIEAHMKQKRARSQLSCTACRQGKLRCNRATPCDQCTKRGKEPSCSYLAPAAKSRSPQNVKGRIQHLEQLVVDLMNSRSSTSNGSNATSNGRTNSTATSIRESPTASQTEASHSNSHSSIGTDKAYPEVTPPYSSDDGNSPIRQHPPETSQLESFGHLRISKEGTSYVGSSHWATILDSISELKRDIEASEDEASEKDFDAWQNEEPLDIYDTGLPGLLRSPRRVTKAQLLSLLPARKEADGLVSTWFRAPHPYKSLIHAPQFQNEYRQFWRSPTSAPVMWIGLLYGMLGMASLFKIRALSNPNTSDVRAAIKQADIYHELSASAAVLGNYMTPKAYTIECLVLHVGSNRTNDFNDMWIVMSVIFRSALRMGYHRDPSHYGNISVLAGEMRRRVWHLLYMIDTLVSFQLGLPAMLRGVQSDTRPPHNLFDQDFSISSKILPSSRPSQEITPSSYGAAKFRICQVFALAADMSHATTVPSHSEIMHLDAKLEEAKAAVPPALQFQAIEYCITEDPESLMCRFNLELLYHKTKVVLHRRFLVATASQPAEPYSRASCIGSAMKTLAHHQAIYRASAPGGQLESVSWYMCSIGTHDFLLSSMIICLELSRQLNEQSDPLTDKIATREDMIAALEGSKQVWEEASGEDCFEPDFGVGRAGQTIENAALTEVRKACKAMAVMLDKVRKDQAQDNISAIAPSNPQSNDWPDMTMPTTISATLPADNNWPVLNQGSVPNDFSALGNMMDVSNDINWEMWDQQLFTQNQTVNLQQPDQFAWTVDDMLAASAPGFTAPDMSMGYDQAPGGMW